MQLPGGSPGGWASGALQGSVRGFLMLAGDLPEGVGAHGGHAGKLARIQGAERVEGRKGSERYKRAPGQGQSGACSSPQREHEAALRPSYATGPRARVDVRPGGAWLWRGLSWSTGPSGRPQPLERGGPAAGSTERSYTGDPELEKPAAGGEIQSRGLGERGGQLGSPGPWLPTRNRVHLQGDGGETAGTFLSVSCHVGRGDGGACGTPIPGG